MRLKIESYIPNTILHSTELMIQGFKLEGTSREGENIFVNERRGQYLFTLELEEQRQYIVSVFVKIK